MSERSLSSSASLRHPWARPAAQCARVGQSPISLRLRLQTVGELETRMERICRWRLLDIDRR